MVERLVEIEGHPWAEMGKSRKPLSQNRLAQMLKPLGIGPEKVGPEEKRLQGYKHERFKEAFARYLPVEGASKVDIRTEPHETGTSEPFQTGQPAPAVQFEKCEKSSNDGLLSTCPVAEMLAGERTLLGADENQGEPKPSTRWPGLSPRAVDQLAREVSGLKTGSATELEDAIRFRLAKSGVPLEAIDIEVKKVVRRIEALGDALPELAPDPDDEHGAPLAAHTRDEPGAPRAASVPFMLTQDMKRRLRAYGYCDEDIAHLTPQRAHEILAEPAPTCAHCGRPGGNEVSFGGAALIRLHQECEGAYRPSEPDLDALVG